MVIRVQVHHKQGVLNWDEVIRRSKRALVDMRLYGVKTTVPYQLAILESEQFESANFNTAFVEEHPELINYSVPAANHHMAVAMAIAIAAHEEQ